MAKRVVVIGTGGAGLVAAIAARMSGAEVAVISKTSRGLGTCTAYSAGVFSLACGGVSSEEHYERTLKTGQFVNDPSLVKILSEETETALKTLAGWGVGIEFKRGMATVRFTARNEIMGGAGFVAELVSIAEKAGVRFEDWTVATSLRLLGDRVVGVEVQDWRTGRQECLGAGSVILATGGGGRLFSRTDNPSRITGDGYALALNAGANLRDMEFVQFYPVGWAEPGFPRWLADVGLVDYLRITDSKGDEFLKKALKEWGFRNGREGNLYARDLCARIMAEKDLEGGVYAHLEDLTEDQWADPYLEYCLTLDSRLFKGVRRPLRVAPLEHYFCGGVVIDGCGRTSVGGLYACGEAAGGVDGANRVGGNALSSVVTFGLRAGHAAAEEGRSGFETLVAGSARDFLAISEEGENPEKLRRELQEEAWAALGPIRENRKMERFLAYLSDFRARRIRVDSSVGRLQALEMEGLFMTARTVAEAALKRETSLGTHYMSGQ
jgi:succinate dehydrogenase/fumarate reductase flavoprotein subunit